MRSTESLVPPDTIALGDNGVLLDNVADSENTELSESSRQPQIISRRGYVL